MRALDHSPMGEYAAQAAIAALHDGAPSHEETDWRRILSLYTVLVRQTNSPVVRLNRAVALAMVDGPESALILVDELAAVRGARRLAPAPRRAGAPLGVAG